MTEVSILIKRNALNEQDYGNLIGSVIDLIRLDRDQSPVQFLDHETEYTRIVTKDLNNSNQVLDLVRTYLPKGIENGDVKVVEDGGGPTYQAVSSSDAATFDDGSAMEVDEETVQH